MTTNNQINHKEEIEKNIIEVFDIENLPEEEQNAKVQEIGSIIFQSVLMRVVPMLSEADLQEYEKIMNNESPDGVDPIDVMDFFFKKIPNFLQILGEETENIKNQAATLLESI